MNDNNKQGIKVLDAMQATLGVVLHYSTVIHRNDKADKSNVWTSSEVHENYLLHGGKGCPKAVFVNLQKHFDDKLGAFSAPGLSSLLCFVLQFQEC